MIELDEHIRKLESADEAERIYAAEDIGYANCAEGVPPLLARLPLETSRAVREAIFAAFESIEDDGVTEGAIGLLANEDSFVRNHAVELLRRRGPGVIPFLRRAFPGADHDGRKLVVDVLAGVDGDGSAEIYDLALADDDVNVVITAVESLGNARKTAFRGRIEELADVANPMLASACLETLAQIGDAHSLEVIRGRIGSPGPPADFLIPSYLKMLGAHGDECAIIEAAGMLNSGRGRLRAAILDAIAMLRKRHPSSVLPGSLLEPLQRIARNDDSPLIRRQALRLLSGLTRQDGLSRREGPGA